MDQVSLYYLTPTGGGFSPSIFTKILDPCISMDARTVGHDEIVSSRFLGPNGDSDVDD